MKAHERIYVALDTSDRERARRLVRALGGTVGGFKVGLQLFTACGSGILREIRDRGAEVFLDLKLHDIPNTVAGAAAAATRLGARYFTLHACGGPAMIRRAVDASVKEAEALGTPRPTALAVTVLTSHGDADLEEIGLRGPCRSAVLRLAALARKAGVGGLVCSSLEVEAVREIFPEGTLVVPGIRPAGGIAPSQDDQTRTATPARAVAAGADLLVIGRPITGAEDPAAAARAIADEIGRTGPT